MRSLMLLLVALALSGAAPAQDDLRLYEQALASDHFPDAAAIVDRLIRQRTPADGKPRVDPQLNALIGRLYAAEGEFAGAKLYLEGASHVEFRPSQQAEDTLALGRVLEAVGDRTRAQEAYRAAATEVHSDALRRAAALGIARTLLPEDPGAAAVEISALQKGGEAADRWQPEYLLALSSSLRGDLPAAQRLADQAWSDAIHARLRDVAPLHVAVLRAGLAAISHDVQTERAMLIAAGGLSVTATPGFAAQLPVCGSDGIQPSDFVIFGFIASQYGHQLVPIAANRREVIKTFYDSLALTVPVTVKGVPFGTVFTVSCRGVVSAGVRTKPVPAQPVLGWLVAHGVYPASITNESDDKHLNAVADRVDALAARFGKENPLLIWPRYQLMQLLKVRALNGDAVVPGQIIDLASQVSAGLRRSGAPDWIAGMIDMQSKLIESVARGGHGEAQVIRSREMMKDMIVQVPADLARELIVQDEARHRGVWNAPAAQIVVDLSGKVTSALSGLDRRSWLVTVANAQRTLGLDRAADISLEAAGFGPNSCARLDQEPKLLQQQFSFENYPQELLSGDQEGAVMFEFNLSPAGAVSEHRIVYSLPSGLFDRASEKGLGTVRYSAPIKDGKESSCNSVYQPVVWRLENMKGPGLPVFRPSPGLDQPTV